MIQKFRAGSSVLMPLIIATAIGSLPLGAADKIENLDRLPTPDAKPADTTKPIKVFILSGQSNMVGMGSRKSLTDIVKNKKMFPNLVDDQGNWTTRKDVQYLYN